MDPAKSDQATMAAAKEDTKRDAEVMVEDLGGPPDDPKSGKKRCAGRPVCIDDHTLAELQRVTEDKLAEIRHFEQYLAQEKRRLEDFAAWKLSIAQTAAERMASPYMVRWKAYRDRMEQTIILVDDRMESTESDPGRPRRYRYDRYHLTRKEYEVLRRWEREARRCRDDIIPLARAYRLEYGATLMRFVWWVSTLIADVGFRLEEDDLKQKTGEGKP